MSSVTISHSQASRASTAESSRWSVVSVVSSFALFLVSAFTIAEMFAFWAFRADGGLLAFVVAALVAAALTIGFRAHMQVTSSDSE